MLDLKSEHIYLRALEPEDIDFLHAIENDTSIWELSHTQVPYSRFVLQQYIKNAKQDIYEAKQLRLVISDYEHRAVGLIDLFDFDFKNKRAGIGIIIKNEEERGNGYGYEALRILINYCFTTLQLHQVYCNISETNQISLRLFKKAGFEIIGLKRDWNSTSKGFSNEYMLQRIKD